MYHAYQYEHINFSIDLLASVTALFRCGVADFAHFLGDAAISLKYSRDR